MLPIKGGHPVARGRRDVKYNEGAELDPSQMGGGRGSGGKIAIGGGAGLIVLLLALLFGLNPGDILGGAPQAGPEESANPSPFAQCTRGSDIKPDRDCRFVAYTNSIQEYWNDNLQGYQTIQVVRPSLAASIPRAAMPLQRSDPSTVQPTPRSTLISDSLTS